MKITSEQVNAVREFVKLQAEIRLLEYKLNNLKIDNRLAAVKLTDVMDGLPEKFVFFHSTGDAYVIRLDVDGDSGHDVELVGEVLK